MLNEGFRTTPSGAVLLISSGHEINLLLFLFTVELPEIEKATTGSNFFLKGSLILMGSDLSKMINIWVKLYR